MRRFGPLIDAYTIPQSVADGATVPILYEARLPELAVEGRSPLTNCSTPCLLEQPEKVRERIAGSMPTRKQWPGLSGASR